MRNSNRLPFIAQRRDQARSTFQEKSKKNSACSALSAVNPVTGNRSTGDLGPVIRDPETSPVLPQQYCHASTTHQGIG